MSRRGNSSDESVSEDWLRHVPRPGDFHRRCGLRGGANQAGRRDAVCGVRHHRAGVARSGRDRSGNLTPFWMLYALHDALVKPMPGNRMAPSLAEILDREPGQARLRIQAAQGPQIPQRRPVHRRGREVQLRARQGRAAEGEGQGGRGRRSAHGAVRAARAVAGLHDVLRHAVRAPPAGSPRRTTSRRSAPTASRSTRSGSAPTSSSA